MIPATLDGWTLDVVRTLLALGVVEDARFDFKEVVPPQADANGKHRLKEAFAAFANGDGGFIVFGVKDSLPTGASSVDDRIVGITSLEVEVGRLNEYANGCDPPVWWAPRNPPIELPSRRVLVIAHIPASGRRPHRVDDKGRWSFPLRSQGATRQMTMIELRAQFADQSKRRRVLSFALSEVERLGRHGNELNLAIQGEGRAMIETAIEWWMTRYDVDELVSGLPDLVEILDGPTLEHIHELVRDAKASDRIAADFVSGRTQAGLKNLAANDSSATRLLAHNAVRIMHAQRHIAEQIRKLLA